jgi:hypothetical protein
MTKLDYGRIYYIGTPPYVIGVPDTIGCREVMSSSLINCLSLSSTKGRFLNSSPTCWQYAHANAISTIGWAFVIDILCWTSGHSIVPIISTFGQIVWLSGCVCWTITNIATISIGSTCGWELHRCESLCYRLHSCSNWRKSWLRSNFEYVVVGFKTRIGSNV